MSSDNNIKDKEIASLFAVLFTYGEPLKISRIAKIMGKKPDQINSLIDNLEESLGKEWSGIMVIRNDNSVSIANKEEFSSVIDKFIKTESKQDLTKASLETLSIIAYFSPISRAKIDYIRGVNSTYILRSLLIRGLIERSFIRGEYVYTPSLDLLKYLGISKIEELPDFEKRKNLSENFFKEWMNVEENSEEKLEVDSNLNQ